MPQTGGSLPPLPGIPPILGQGTNQGSSVDINAAARKACRDDCLIRFPKDAQGNLTPEFIACGDRCDKLHPVQIDPALFGLTGDELACGYCSVTNIRACFACFKVAALQVLTFGVTNLAVIIIVAGGVYMIVSGQTPAQGFRAAAKTAARVAA